MSAPALPPSTELYVLRDFVARHPHLLSEARVRWAVRNREENGLAAARGVYASASGDLVIHEPVFLAWWLGLSGRHRPRATRRRRILSA